MNETVFMNVKDPSGETRTLKIREFPVELGTRFEDLRGLRDSKIGWSSLTLEFKKFGEEDMLILKSRQDGLMIRLGELKFPSIQVPYGVPLSVGDTELTFFDRDPAKKVLPAISSESKWYSESESGIQLLESLKKSSQTRLPIYLFGETGTGKELLAEQIHLWSNRAAGSFIAINCGALPLTLAESELFGHLKGSFTGASRDRTGALLQAHNGTLFLDEVGDLPMELQVKLLRFLECGEIRAVGSDRVMHADVRVICATHKPLQKLVEEGKFRQDLYYRLASIVVEIPNLNSRPEDIRALAIQFAKHQQKVLTEEAIQRLVAQPWAGNVRELRHAIERACGVAGPSDVMLSESDFKFLQQNSSGMELAEKLVVGHCTLEEMEKVMMLRALKEARGNRTQAAKLLGIARSTLFDMIKRHRVVGPKSIEYRIEDETV